MNAKTFSALMLLAAMLFVTAGSATAELQNVTVGGEVRIRASYWMNTFNPRTQPFLAGRGLRWPSIWMTARPIGDFVGGQNVTSYYDWDKRRADYDVVEQRTTLNVTADFTNEVRAFIELESFDVWGEDFRSNWITGADNRAATADDLEIYQAYIEASQMFGWPLTARIGRQEIVLGSGWLVGNNLNHPEFAGLSFDGISLTYATDLFSVMAFWTKLNETGAAEEDGDTDFYGLYASYTGLENITIDAYWLWLRDAGMLNDTNFIWFVEWLEDLFGVDDYDVTNLHTIGLRAAGAIGAFDFEAEAAYQFGNADRVGFLFKPFLYGDDGAKYDEWALNLELGYTFDVAWQPRVYLGFAYLGGEDNRDISWFEWWWPFDSPKSSVSFNRLFSNTVYSNFIDELGELSNVWIARGGVRAMPTESVEVGLDVAYFEALETFDLPVYFRLGNFMIPIAPALSFWTTSSSAELGWELGIWALYHYSEDLSFKAGWSHFFTGEGLRTGNYNDFNGLLSNAGTSKDDADYLYMETVLKF